MNSRDRQTLGVTAPTGKGWNFIGTSWRAATRLAASTASKTKLRTTMPLKTTYFGSLMPTKVTNGAAMRLVHAARLLLLGWACSSYFKASLLNRGVRGFPFVPMSHSAKRSLIAYHLLLWYVGLQTVATAGDPESLFVRLFEKLGAKVGGL